jgi:molybdopterin molybdotransferase
MPEFLQLIPVHEAVRLYQAAVKDIRLSVEKIPTFDGLGRILAEGISAVENLPSFPRSTMDGYAVRAEDTYGASDSLPIYLEVIGEVKMGETPSFELQVGQAAVIHTGGMLPTGSDAVVMIERTQRPDENQVEILKSVSCGENMIAVGEDVQIGEEVLHQGLRLTPAALGGILSMGIMEITVFRQPRVGIISSGDEVVSPESPVAPGQVRDINSFSLSALIQKSGGIPKRYGVVPDDPDALFTLLRKAADENDMVVVTAGSSASVRDLTAEAIQKLGAPGVLVHGVNVKPGKPTILGLCDHKPVIGLPGNPVSALVIARLFVEPLLWHLGGEKDRISTPPILAKVEVNYASLAGREDWVPIQLSVREGVYYAMPIFYKSNLIFTLAQANGLMRISPQATGVSAGDWVEAFLI